MTETEADHERTAATLARLAAAPPPVTVGADTLAYLGLDPRSIQARALVLLAERYGLDPLLGHVSVIATKNGNRVYITRDGMLDVGHRSGQLDGIVVDEQRESDHGYSATVSVWRKDMTHPFTYRGGCGADEPQAKAGNGAEMALARAERRALHRAFNIPLEDDEAAKADDPPAAHRIVEGAAPKDKLVCACGEIFATAAAFHQHTRPAEIPGPVPAPPSPGAAAGVARPPAATPAGPGPKPSRRADSPPPEYYDQLPESTGRG